MTENMTENMMKTYLENCDRLYAQGISGISDIEYDKIKNTFRQSFPKNPYNNIVGTSVDGEKVKLPFVLGSLNKVKTDGSCQKWMDENKGEKIYWAKLDGVSALVQYVDGVYTRAFTRGDGEYGQDITNKLRQAVTQKLTVPVTGYYRAEIMLIGDVHKELGYKTRRNGAAGIINRDGIEQCEYLEVLFYELVEEIDKSFEYEIDRILEMVSLGLEVAPYTRSDKSLSDRELVSLLRDWKTWNVYDIDGIVIVLNESEREDTYYPELKCAFKVNEEATICKVVGVTWQIGRTGRVIPVVNIEPTEIGGVTISNATGFNAEFIYYNGIGVDAEVGIFRANEVIPYIDFVQKSIEMNFYDDDSYCPSCGSILIWKGVDLVCNATECLDRDTLQVEHFLTTLGCENVTAVTLKKLGVKTIKDVYELDEFEISMLDGFGIKRAQQIIFEINKTLKTTPDKLLASFGMTGIGKSVSQSILKVYDFGDIWSITEGQLTEIDGVGDVLADNFVIEISPFIDIYFYLKAQGLEWSTATNNLKGKTFCLTGNGLIKRDELVKMIESNGGYVKNMSKKVDNLITSDPNSQSGKAKKAREYGIPVISYEDLMDILG